MYHPIENAIWIFYPEVGELWRWIEGQFEPVTTGILLEGIAPKDATSATLYWDAERARVGFAALVGFAEQPPDVFEYADGRFDRVETADGGSSNGYDVIVWDAERQRLVHVLALFRRDQDRGVRCRELVRTGASATWRDAGPAAPEIGSLNVYAGFDEARGLIVALDTDGNCAGFDGTSWSALPKHPDGGWGPVHFTASPRSRRLVMLHTERATWPKSILWELGEDAWHRKEANIVPWRGQLSFDRGVRTAAGRTLFFLAHETEGHPPQVFGEYDGERILPTGPVFPPCERLAAGAGRVVSFNVSLGATRGAGREPWTAVPAFGWGVYGLHVHEGGLHALTGDAALYSLGESGTWRNIAEAPPGFVSRRNAAVAWSAPGPKSAPERVYALGGAPIDGSKFPTDCFRWTPDAGWTSLEIVGKKPAFQHMLACWDPGRKVLVVVGGRDKRYKSNDFTFETDEKKWTSFLTQMEGGTARGATLTYDAALDRVLLLSSNEVRAYEGKGKWRLIGTMPAPSGGATEVAYDGEARTLYALGGTGADGFQRVALGALLDEAARAPSAPPGETVPEESSPTKRYLRSDEGGTDKFWFAELSERSFQVRWGQRGTAGQTEVHELDNAAAARRAFDKMVAEKLDEGYWDAPEGERAAELPGKTSYHWELGCDGDDVAGGPSPVANVPVCSGCERPMVHIVTLAAHPERLPLAKHAALSAYICANEAGNCGTFDAHGGGNAVLLHQTLPAAWKGDAPAKEEGVPMLEAKRIAYTARFEPDPEGDDADDLALANKTGGYPAWYQFADVPACRVCTKPMRFVAEFSEFDDVLNFGGDGEAYVFVCSEEHEGALLWQCG
ncbi:Hypothetical protein A7982_03897 [Minicystis rosea]|nr:Hypothetical protein A7982_03897 [Minicystis rosea]